VPARPILTALAVLGGTLPGAEGMALAGGQSPVVAMPVRPATAERPWTVVKVSPSGCVSMTSLAGALVIDPRTLELVLRGGQRLRLLFAEDCPQLSYYGGFYYSPDRQGRLCAGRDRLMGRDGGNCPIAGVATLRRPR